MNDQYWDVLIKVVIGGGALLALAYGLSLVRHRWITASAEARAKVMAQVRAVRVPGGTFLVLGTARLDRVVGDFYTDDETDDETPEPATMNPDDLKDHDAAVKVIEASLKANGADSKAIVAGNKSGLGGTVWQRGVNHLKDLGHVWIVSDGNKQSTQSRDKTLGELMTTLAISSLPRPKSAA